LYSVVDHIRDEFIKRGNAGMWSGYVRNHLLPRLFGFELLMAPYAVAHFKLGMQLAAQDLGENARGAWAYDFSGDERLGIYLTNTLEEAERHVETLFGPFRIITDEANAAAKIKRDLPIMVIIGNPPYSGISANMGNWIIKLLKGGELASKEKIAEKIVGYYEVDGKPLGEKNPKWLQDDYVKFIRWAQWRIEKTGAGILAFITNHSYLDNPTFRGMRQQLMKAFDEIYILNLHGSTKKKERCPDGSKDENVFDIQQGVAVAVFIKESQSSKPAKVFYADLWGLRQQKYESLFEQDVKITDWQEFEPNTPFYLFIPQATELRTEYETGWKVTEVMPVNGVGMTTARDHIVIDFKPDPIIERAREFRDSPLSDIEVCRNLSIPLKKGWNIANARKLIKEVADLHAELKPVLYRPFDTRVIFYHDSLVWRTVKQVMRHMLAGENLGLLWTRPMSPTYEFSVLTTSLIIDQCAVGNKSAGAGISYLGPLYLYLASEDFKKQEKLHDDLHYPKGKGGRVPNLNPEFIADVEKRIGLKFISDGKGNLEKTFGPEDVFNYIYAVFHSPAYRKRYAEFLKIDFPRVPLTSNLELFRELCQRGEKLVALHLLESPLLSNRMTRYPITGDNLVDKGHPKYLAPNEPEPNTGKPLVSGRVYINKGQYFEGVPKEVWEFHIGGYQVLQKWLKDRHGRNLSYEELETYQKIVVALSETIRLMKEIDDTIEKFGNWPLQ